MPVPPPRSATFLSHLITPKNIPLNRLRIQPSSAYAKTDLVATHTLIHDAPRCLFLSITPASRNLIYHPTDQLSPSPQMFTEKQWTPGNLALMLHSIYPFTYSYLPHQKYPICSASHLCLPMKPVTEKSCEWNVHLYTSTRYSCIRKHKIEEGCSWSNVIRDSRRDLVSPIPAETCVKLKEAVTENSMPQNINHRTPITTITVFCHFGTYLTTREDMDSHSNVLLLGGYMRSL